MNLISYNIEHGEQLLFLFGALPDFSRALPPPELGASVQPPGVAAALLANDEVVQVVEILRRLL